MKKLKIKSIQELRPPEGATIKTLNVTVSLSRAWDECIKELPDTWSGSDIHKVGYLYPPSDRTVKSDIVLLNFPKGGLSWDKALSWAKENNLSFTDPREVFSLGKQYDLKKELGNQYGYSVATTECTFDGNRNACYVWWHDSEREAGLDEVEVFGHSDGWFAFRMNSELGKSVPSDTLDLALGRVEKKLDALINHLGVK